MTYFKNRNCILIYLVLLLVLITPNLVFAETATPVSFFSDAFLRMRINRDLTPGFEVESLSFQKNQGGFTDQLTAAALRDLEDKLMLKLVESQIPEHTKKFLIEKMSEMDTYSFLVSRCIVRRDDCKKNMFKIVVTAKASRGFQNTRYRCDTELIFQEPRRRIFSSDIEGDIRLLISDCKLLTPGMTEPSLSALSRSGYKSDQALEVSLNEQVDFLRRVEDYQRHATTEEVSTDRVGNAEVFVEAGVDNNHGGNPVSSVLSEVNRPGWGSGTFPKPLPENNDRTRRYSESFEPYQNPARYCRVIMDNTEYSCILDQPMSPQSACYCDVTGNTEGVSRI